MTRQGTRHTRDGAHVSSSLPPPSAAQVGSGAWATAAVRMLAQNCREDDPADQFADDLRMWVFEEDWEVRGSSMCQAP
jgi:glycerol-3-phosphate dehydrogenase (NAD+)